MKKNIMLVGIALIVISIISFFTLQKSNFNSNSQVTATPENIAESPAPNQESPSTTPSENNPEASSPKKPLNINGIYCTSWIAGSQRMNEIVQFIKDNKEINAIVIDVKDDTGIISYPSEIPLANEIGASSKRAPKLKELVAELNKNNIYTIARIVVFKDPLLASKHPEIAVKDRNGGNWRDRKGMVWVDPHCQKVWQYNLDIAKEAVKMGFSEIQFDYVRFLSDGKISNAVYP